MTPSNIDQALQRIAYSCRATAELEQYAREALTPVHATWVGMHLEECELCMARLAVFRAAPPSLAEQAREHATGILDRMRAAVRGLAEPIRLAVDEVGVHLHGGGLTPVFAASTLRDNARTLGGFTAVMLDEDTNLNLRIEWASASSVRVRLTALQPISMTVEVRDAAGARHARQRLDHVAEFELGLEAWTLHLLRGEPAVEVTVPIEVTTAISP